MGRGKGRQKISLALQGGGAHGAYTWGVLDRLLEDNRFDIGAVTATSAGAINAAALAAGFAENGADGAREHLQSLWRAISEESGRFVPQGAIVPAAFAYLTALQSVVSPYDFNPFDLNPLRDVLEREIDFDALRASPLHLYVSATNVETGKPRIFTTAELSIDALLASSCLPQTFKAVEIDGAAYWDGGYVGNPSLFPLIYSGAPRDVLLVILNPLTRKGVPTRAEEIQDRINEISFNAALIGELRAIAFVQRLIDEGALKEPLLGRYRRLNIHAVHGGRDLVGADLSSKYDTHWPFLKNLRDKGRAAASIWLDTCAQHVGTQKSAFDLRAEFLEP
jgi:NTE family protein